MAKFCQGCGKELNDGADVCVGCGKVVQKEATATSGATANTANNGVSIGALVCGIASIIFCWWGYLSIIGIIAGIVAVVLGAKGRKASPEGKKGMATAGLVLGIIGLALGAIFFICAVCVASAVISGLNY